MKGGDGLKKGDESAVGEHWSPRQAGWPVIVLRRALAEVEAGLGGSSGESV
jgi:hypothetical protein